MNEHDDDLIMRALGNGGLLDDPEEMPGCIFCRDASYAYCWCCTECGTHWCGTEDGNGEVFD